MSEKTLKKLKYDNKDIIAEVAIRDGNGCIITDTYVDKNNNQVINGQKDFNTTPRVRIDGEHPREGLPTELYTQLQYVESDGSQYIDTTYAINTTTDTVEIVFECIGTTIYKWLFGEHDNNARFGLGVGDGSNKRNVAYGASTYKVNDTLFYNQLHHFKADSTGVFIDDTKIANYSGFSSTSSLALFCLNNNGFANGTAAKIQSYKHTRNNVALIDLVAVKRNSDTKAGFYDFVSENFISSATSNDLSAGPELPGPHYEALITDANFASVAFSGSYTDLINQPTIPTVNNATLTIQKNGTTVSTFTANASSNVTANITVPTTTSDLTNNSGFITSSYHDSTKEDVSNKVTSISSSSTNTQYPSAKCVYDNIENVREVAEGKKQTYVISDVTNPSFNSQVTDLVIHGFTDIEDNNYTFSNLQIGDTIYVKESDVPDRWVSQFIPSAAVDTTITLVTKSTGYCDAIINYGGITETLKDTNKNKTIYSSFTDAIRFQFLTSSNNYIRIYCDKELSVKNPTTGEYYIKDELILESTRQASTSNNIEITILNDSDKNIVFTILETTKVDLTSYATKSELNNYMTALNPTGTGSLSINRLADLDRGTDSVSVGLDGVSLGDYSFSEGKYSYSFGTASHSEGSNTQKYITHLTGSANSTSYTYVENVGEYGFIEYNGTVRYILTKESGVITLSGTLDAENALSNTEVNYFNASAFGNSSHVEGSNTRAIGNNSHAEGATTYAIGNTSHAEGGATKALGSQSHAEGLSTVASHRSQHVFGEFNELDPSANANTQKGTYIEIVGNGTSSSAKSNARTLDWNGNEVLAGTLTATNVYANNLVTTSNALSILETISNYDDTKTQTLTNVNGTLSWVQQPNILSGLYLHTIFINLSYLLSDAKVTMSIISNSATVYDFSSLSTFLNDRGNNTSSKVYPANGQYYSSSTAYQSDGCYRSGSGTITVCYKDGANDASTALDVGSGNGSISLSDIVSTLL